MKALFGTFLILSGNDECMGEALAIDELHALNSCRAGLDAELEAIPALRKSSAEFVIPFAGLSVILSRRMGLKPVVRAERRVFTNLDAP